MQLFAETLQRLRRGDPEAVREFVATYEPFIRRSVRRRLAGTSFQAAADSVDVCQSAMASFLIRCAAGEFELNDLQSMEKLIFTIAQRKLFALMRHESAECRDRKRMVSWYGVSDVDTDSTSDPQQRVVSAELLDEVDRRLKPDDQRLFRLRREGLDWETIANGHSATETCNAAMLRKRLSRALRHAALELGLDLDDV